MINLRGCLTRATCAITTGRARGRPCQRAALAEGALEISHYDLVLDHHSATDRHTRGLPAWVGRHAAAGTGSDADRAAAWWERAALAWICTAPTRWHRSRLATTSRVRSSHRLSSGGSGRPAVAARPAPAVLVSPQVRWGSAASWSSRPGSPGGHPSSDRGVCAAFSPGPPCRAFGGGVCGSTRPASDWALAVPLRDEQRRGRVREDVISVLARAVREVRGGCRAWPRDARGAHEVPGRRTAGARGARPSSGGADRQPGPPGRAAQAPGRDRDDPREDRRTRPRAARAPRGGCRRLRRGPVAQAGHAEDGGHRAGPRAGRAGGACGRCPPAPSAGSCPSRSSRGSWPTPSSPLTSPPPGRARSGPRRLAGWELLNPLLSSFERAGGGAPACMALPAPTAACACRANRELMPHQAQLVAAAAAGHRTFLLADEPGLGKTAQALLAARGGERLPAARGRAERRQDQLGARGRPVDTAPLGHRGPRQR